MRGFGSIGLGISLLYTLILFSGIGQTSAFTAATGIHSYIQITLANNQQSASPATTQLMVTIPANTYSLYYTCNLNNAEFFLPNGMVIDSWLEGNLLNEMSANSMCTSASSQNALVAGSNIIYWIKGVYIPANTGGAGSNTVYLGWSGNVISSSNTLLNKVTTGEAPQLSCPSPINTISCGTYGMYDNGNYIFNFYDNFSGQSLSSTWHSGGGGIGYVVDNGFSAISTGSGGYLYSTALAIKPAQYIADYYGTTFQSSSNWEATGIGQSSGWPSFSVIYAQAGDMTGVQADSGGGLSPGGSGTISTSAAPQVWTIAPTSSSTSHYYENYSGDYTVSVNAPSYPVYEKLVSANANGEPYSFDTPTSITWYRIRAYPPGGVMPSISLSGVQSVTATVVASNAVIDAGQYETITANYIVQSGVSPFTFNFFVVNSISTGTVIHSTSFGGVVSNIQQYTFQTTTADAYNSPESANVVVTDSSQSVSNSSYTTFIVNPLPAVSLISSSNAIGSPYTYELLTATWTGGTSAYTGNFYVTNSMNGNVIAKAIISRISGKSTTFLYQVPSNANALGTENIMFSLSDSQGMSASASNTISIQVNNEAPVLTITSNDIPYGKLGPITVTPTPLSNGPANIIFNGNQVLSGSGIQTYTICGPYPTASTCVPQGTYSVKACDYTDNMCSQSNTVVIGPPMAPISPPSGITYYVPITLTNTQSGPVTAGTSLMITIPVNAYSAYYTCNLNNAEFFWGDGILVNSWMEGNVLSEMSANSMCTSASSQNALISSNAILYWVNGVYLPADSGSPTTNTIYLGWAGNVLGTANSLLNNITTGEAPELSCPSPINASTCGTYGKYDNGNYVFNFYDNFVGNTLSSRWTTVASETSQVSYNVSNSLSISSTCGWCGVYATYNVPPNSIIDTIFFDSDSNLYTSIGLTGPAQEYGSATWPSFELRGTDWGIEQQGCPCVYDGSATPGSWYILSGVLPVLSNILLYTNYTALQVNFGYTYSPTTFPSNYIDLFPGGNENTVYQWVRVRTYPPSGVMPAASFNSVQPVTSIISVSNSLVEIGQYETITANYIQYGLSPFTFNFFVANSVSKGVIVHSATFPQVSNTFQTYTFQVTSADVSNSPEAVNVVVTNSTPAVSASAYATFTAYPSLSIVSLSSSNSVALKGTYELLTATWTGGAPTYTGNFYVTNSMNGNVIANSIISDISGNSVGLLYRIPFNSNALGTENVKFTLTDSASQPQTISSTNTITVEPNGNSAPILSMTSNTIAYGQADAFTVTPTPLSVGPANIVIDGMQIVNGSGIQTYTYCDASGMGLCLAPGAYSVYACDYTNNQCSASNTLTVTKGAALLAINSPASVTYNGMSPDVSFSVASYHNQLPSTIYLNSNVVSNTITGPIIVNTISGFSNPNYVAIAPSGTYGYVTNNNGTIGIVDVATNSVTGLIPSLANPYDIAFNPSGAYAYYSDCPDDRIYVINTTTNSVASYLSGFSCPRGIAFNPSGTLAYIANQYGPTLVAMNTSTNAIVNTISGLYAPQEVALSPSGTLIYVANDNDTVSVVNTLTNTITNTISGFNNNYGVAFSQSGAYAYVTNNGNNTISVVNTATNSIESTIKGFNSPVGVAFSASGKYAYVTNYGNTSLSVLDNYPDGLASLNYTKIPAAAAGEYGITANTPGNGNYMSNSISVELNISKASPILTISVPSVSNYTGAQFNVYSSIFTHQNQVASSLYLDGTLESNTLTGYIQNITTFSLPYDVAIYQSGGYAYVTSYVQNGTVSVVNTTTHLVTNTISGLNYPVGVAFSPSGAFAYVANYDNGNVAIVNTLTRSITNTMPGFDNPSYTAFSPSTPIAYVSNYGNNTVSVVNTITNTITNTISGFDGPEDIAFTPSGNVAYVMNYNNYSVSIVDTATNQIVHGLVFVNPSSVAISPSGQLAYIANENNDTLSVVNTVTNSITNTISGFSVPSGVAINPSGTLIYVTNQNTDTVSVVNTMTNTITNTISGFVGPVGVTFNPSGTLAYVSDYLNSSVEAVNTMSNAIVNTITTFSYPYGIAASPSGTYMYVVNFGNNTVSVVDTATNSVVSIIQGFNSPEGIAFAPSGSFAYVTNENNNTVGIIDAASNSVTGTISGFTSPTAVAISPLGTYAYVTNSSGLLNIVDVATNSLRKGTVGYSGSIPGFYEPFGIALSPSGSLAYVTNYGNGTVSVFNTITNSITGTIHGFQYPLGISVDPSGNYAYVTGFYGPIKVVDLHNNSISNTIGYRSVIPNFASPYTVTFAPSGAFAYVTNYNNATITMVNTTTNTFIGQITGLNGPDGFAISPSGTYGYAINYGNSSISIVDIATNTITGNIAGLDNPYGGAAFAPSGTYAYVTSYSNDTVSIVNTATNSISGTISGFSYPTGVDFNPSGTLAYVQNYDNSTISVVSTSTNSITGTLTGFENSYIGVTFSPSGAYAYITNYYNGSISVLNTQTNTIQDTIYGLYYPFEAGFAPSGAYAYVANNGNSSIMRINTGTTSYGVSAIGSYTFTASTAGNANYTSNSISTEFTISPAPPTTTIPCTNGCHTGSGGTGTGQSNTTLSTTSAVSTTTTITQNQTHSNQTSKVNITVSNHTVQTLYLNNTGAKLSIMFNGHGSTNLQITVNNVTITSPPAPRGYLKLSAINISFSNSSVTANVTLRYPCSLPAQAKPFILRNGTWSAITPFILDSASCSVMFTIPSDPVVALMEQNSSTSTIIQNTTTSALATTAAQQSQQQSGTGTAVALAIVIIAVAVAVYWLKFRRSSPRLGS